MEQVSPDAGAGSDRYIDVPLEATYQAAFLGLPAFWRQILASGTR
jgi:hypothetical protein